MRPPVYYRLVDEVVTKEVGLAEFLLIREEAKTNQLLHFDRDGHFVLVKPGHPLNDTLEVVKVAPFALEVDNLRAKDKVEACNKESPDVWHVR